MSITTTPVGKYDSDERLLNPTGSEGQRQLNQMKTRIIARYKLRAVQGRPEELQLISMPDLGVSFGYSSGQIRVRTMVGRDWTDTRDFIIKEGWAGDLYAFLDPHFGYVIAVKPRDRD